jgi:hypothetical protein
MESLFASAQNLSKVSESGGMEGNFPYLFSYLLKIAFEPWLKDTAIKRHSSISGMCVLQNRKTGDEGSNCTYRKQIRWSKRTWHILFILNMYWELRSSGSLRSSHLHRGGSLKSRRYLMFQKTIRIFATWHQSATFIVSKHTKMGHRNLYVLQDNSTRSVTP